MTRVKKNYIRKELFPISYYYMNLIFGRIIKPKSFLCFDKKYFIMYIFMAQFGCILFLPNLPKKN